MNKNRFLGFEFYSINGISYSHFLPIFTQLSAFLFFMSFVSLFVCFVFTVSLHLIYLELSLICSLLSTLDHL